MKEVSNKNETVEVLGKSKWQMFKDKFDGPQSGKGPMVVDEPFNCDGDGETPYGMKWGGGTIGLSREHLEALFNGKYVAIEVENEYVNFLKLNDDNEEKKIDNEK